MQILVDELPESCFECPIMVDGSEGCDFCVCAILEEKATTKNRLKDCPLKSLHDRELVKEVCEKIKLKFSDTRSHNWGIEQIELYEFLDQIQRNLDNE